MSHKIQVRARTSPLEILATNLSDVIALPDGEAAIALNDRIGLLNQIERIYERSYAERGIIAREFERRKLWQFLIDPLTNQPFPNFSAWMSCPEILGCKRRTNFDAYGDMKLLADVPADKLIGVPKSNLREMIKLSTNVRNDESILIAAKTLRREEFLEKIEKDHPDQHIQGTTDMRFSPGRSWAKDIEATIAYAREHDIAGDRDEALWRMAQTALKDWKLDEELKQIAADEAKVTA